MKLMHPASKIEVEVPDSRAAMYVSQGWRQVTAGSPPASASLKKWQEFARSQGFEEADIKGKTRAELRAALA